MSLTFAPGDTFRGGFTLRRIDTGARANADSTPTITLYKNGTVDGAVTLTPAQVSGKTGTYQVSGTIPGGYSNGDYIEVLAEATVNSVTDSRWIYKGRLDVQVNSRSSHSALDVWNVLTSALTTASTAGKLLVDNLNATVSSRSTLTAANVWDALTSGLTTNGSIGKRIVDYLTGDIYARLGAPSGASIAADLLTLLNRLTSTRAGNLDNLDASVLGVGVIASSAATSAASADTKTTTILARIGGLLGTGVDTLKGYLEALASKTATLPTGIGGTFDPATDSTEAIRDRGDAAWTGGGGGGGGDGVILRRGPYQGKVDDGRPGAVVPLSVDDMVTLVIDCVDANGDEVPTGSASYTTVVKDRAGTVISSGVATPSDDDTRGRILWDNAAEDTESSRTLYLYITRTDGAQVDTLRPIVLSIT